MQYLFSPLRKASDSETEEGVNGDSNGEGAAESDMALAKGIVGTQRRKEALKKCKGKT